MQKTLATLKSVVCAFMHRKPAVFVESGVDLVTIACNNARLYAERVINFEWAKDQADLVVADISSGASIDNAVRHGTATAIRIKKVLTPYLTISTSGTASAIPVELWSREKWNSRVTRMFASTAASQQTTSPLEITGPLVVVQDGKTLFATPFDSTVLGTGYTISCTCLKWLDDYEDADPETQTDFIIDYAFDWMMYRVIQELNFFLKEDDRVQIEAALVSDAWNALVKWNNELVAANVDDVNME